ncbi:MAG: GNAT family N-acetyltransferase [Clostridiales bacterium]|nr:GNAT family N-acetyltransferase [Clostridiales bacterium]
MPCETRDFESGRLLMRKFRYDDIDSMMRNWISDDDVQNKYGEPAYKTREEVRSLLDAFICRYQSGYGFRWAVIEKSSGECIGQIAYFLVNAESGFGEIEYCIGRAYQGRGYATEAARAVIDHGFDVIGFNKVQICVRPANTPSQKVIDKCGFKYDGTLRDYFLIDGEHQDRKYYSILKNER